LGHSRKTVQRGAAAQLARFAQLQPEIIVGLTARLADPEPRVRWTAAFTLSQLDLTEPTSLPVLIENLGHQESDLRWAAATAVVRLAAQHPRVVEELLRLASTGNVVQKRMALYCLRDLGQTTPAAQTVYFTSLSDPDPLVRLGGLSCLGKLKLASSAARESLLRMLDADSDLGVRRATAVTLGQLDDHAPEVLDALARIVQSNDTALRKAATGALEKLQKGL
jgi:HEAT repeat protein